MRAWRAGGAGGGHLRKSRPVVFTIAIAARRFHLRQSVSGPPRPPRGGRFHHRQCGPVESENANPQIQIPSRQSGAVAGRPANSRAVKIGRVRIKS